MDNIYFLGYIFTLNILGIDSLFPRILNSNSQNEVEIQIHPKYQPTEKSGSAYPESIELSVSRDGGDMMFHLEPLETSNLDFPILLKRGEAIVKYEETQREEIRFYSDVSHNSLLMTSISAVKEQGDDVNWFGTLAIGPDTYRLQPPDKKQNRYTLSKLDSEKELLFDHLSQSSKDSRPSRDYTPLDKTGFHKRKKRNVESYEVELLLAVDYSIYSTWYNETENETESERHGIAIEYIRQYFAFVLVSMNIAYSAITNRDYTIGILFAGIYIADTPEGAPFTEHNKLPSPTGNPRIVDEVVLDNFRFWSQINLRHSIDYDHAMLLTKYDISVVQVPFFNSASLGYAFIASLCGDYRYSIVEDLSLEQTILVAIHELGHSLGAQHDGTLDGNTCDTSDGFIMATFFQFIILDDLDHNRNRYQFSTCSLDYFEEFSQWLNDNDDNCMLQRSAAYNASALDEFSQTPPGQVFPPDEQCTAQYGEGSYLYRHAYTDGHFESICALMICSFVQNNGSGWLTLPLYGTSCGIGKVCELGNCVESEYGPTNVHADCLFGDVPGNVVTTTSTCIDALSTSDTSWWCYYPDIFLSCCATCYEFKEANAHIQDCEFGDKHAFCATLDLNDCVLSNNSDVCCRRCYTGPGLTTDSLQSSTEASTITTESITSQTTPAPSTIVSSTISSQGATNSITVAPTPSIEEIMTTQSIMQSRTSTDTHAISRRTSTPNGEQTIEITSQSIQVLSTAQNGEFDDSTESDSKGSKSDDTLMIIIIVCVVACILLVVLLATLVIYLRKRKKINAHHRAKPYEKKIESTQVQETNAIEPSAPHYDDQYDITTFGHSLSQPTYRMPTLPNAEPAKNTQTSYDEQQQLPVAQLSSDNTNENPGTPLQQPQNARLTHDAPKYIDISDDDNYYRTETPEKRNTYLSLEISRSMPGEGTT